jgi:hypothetical protein
VRNAKQGTKSRNKKIVQNKWGDSLKCTITIEDLVGLYIKQQGRCYYSNVPFQYRYIPDGSEFDVLRQMSIERMNPKRGYEIDNICFCLLGLNTTDLSRIAKYSNGGSCGWSKLKIDYVFRWLEEKNRCIVSPSMSFEEFSLKHDK